MYNNYYFKYCSVYKIACYSVNYSCNCIDIHIYKKNDKMMTNYSSTIWTDFSSRDSHILNLILKV